MINFVVVEDNPLHMKKSKDMIVNYMMRNNYEFDIIEFSKITEKFRRIIEDDNNYIYILDFELGSTNAIEVAREIRKRDWISPIIVFTVNGGMAFETFKQRLQILDFVNKQYEAEKNMYELFDICFEQLKIRKTFKYKISKIDYSIDYDKILYIYKDTTERKSVIVTNNNRYKIPITLKKMKERLPENFAYSHKSCIVNKRRVDMYDWVKGKINFDTGEEIMFLSRTHKKELVRG